MRVDCEALFRQILDDHHAVIHKVARAYANTADDRQDLVQEILLQAWRSLPQFQQQSSLFTWIYRVALNTAISWNRHELTFQRRRKPLLELDETPTADNTNSEQRELIARLYAAIHQLPKPDTALILLYLDNLSYRQMADITGISENHVGVKLNRAKKALGELMQEPNDGT